MDKREVEIVVISDVHLGTYGCHAKELLKYLKSIKPKTVILNGDIIDIWQFSKRYWPETHMKIIRKLMKFVVEGVPVYYLTGNHDEMLRKFADMHMGAFHLQNKLVLELDGKKAWFFHGDIFDVTMQHSKWLAKLGAIGYDSLILLNSFVNWCLTTFGRQKMSFSQKIKSKFKDAVKFINSFEQTAAELAIENGYDSNIFAAYAEGDILFSKRLAMKVGLRYSNNSLLNENNVFNRIFWPPSSLIGAFTYRHFALCLCPYFISTFSKS